jgi:hypothetical protein
LPVTTDIAASYRRPGDVLRDKLARAPSEARALAYLMGACGVMFVASWPKIARDTYLEDPARWQAEGGAFRDAVQPAIGGALMGTLIFLPLLCYGLALLVQGLAALTKPGVPGHDVRLVVFWALLAATPLALLNGMVAGFIGPGPVLNGVGALWFGAFVWFCITGVREARRLMAKETA